MAAAHFCRVSFRPPLRIASEPSTQERQGRQGFAFSPFSCSETVRRQKRQTEAGISRGMEWECTAPHLMKSCDVISRIRIGAIETASRWVAGAPHRLFFESGGGYAIQDGRFAREEWETRPVLGRM